MPRPATNTMVVSREVRLIRPPEQTALVTTRERLSSHSRRSEERGEGLLELQFTSRIHWRREKFVGQVSRGGMIYFRAPAILLQALVRFRPARQCGALLGPMDDRGFVAPLDQLAHGPAVSARSHKLLHCRFTCPDGARPGDVPLFSEQLHGEIPFSPGRLPRNLSY